MGAVFDSHTGFSEYARARGSVAGAVAAGKPWNDRLTLLLESTGEGIFGIDLDGRCTFINRAGAEMLGYRPNRYWAATCIT